MENDGIFSLYIFLKTKIQQYMMFLLILFMATPASACCCLSAAGCDGGCWLLAYRDRKQKK
jgi:hypothetical protein